MGHQQKCTLRVRVDMEVMAENGRLHIAHNFRT